MKASGASLLFEQKGLPFKGLDAFFDGLKAGFEDGFVLARRGDALRYFFVIQGKPYIAAVIDGGAARVTSIEDFFSWYRCVETADIEVYKADKKVLLCLLVRIHYSPELSFTTDQMAPEEVIENMEGKGKDAVIAVSDAGGESGLWHFVIFVGGKVAYTTLLGEGDVGTEEESPADRLISYIMSADKGTPLLVEIYVDTQITPAADAMAFEDKGITGQYLGLADGLPPASEAVFEAEPPAEPEAGKALEPAFGAEAGSEPELEMPEPDTLPGGESTLNGESTPDGALTPDGGLSGEAVDEDVLPQGAGALELEVGEGAGEPFMESTDQAQESGVGREPEPLQGAESEPLRAGPEEEGLEEAAGLSAEEPGQGRAGDGEEFPEELLEEVSAEFTMEEESFTAESLPGEFAGLSIDELSESFDPPGGDEAGKGEEGGDLPPAGAKDDDGILTGNVTELQAQVKETEAGQEVSGPEAGADDLLAGNAPVTGNAPEVPFLSEDPSLEEDPFSADEGFTFEEDTSVDSEDPDGSSLSPEGAFAEEPLLTQEDAGQDIIEDLEDSGIETTFGLDDSAGFTEDTPEFEVEESGGEVVRGREEAAAQESAAGEATGDGPGAVIPEEEPQAGASAVQKDSFFKPLPIEEDMGQRQPKAHPLTATLTGKDGVVFTLGSITNIGKEEGSEIKLEGMLAARKLAAIIRGKDSFKVVKKGGGKSALKVNGDKVDGELELKDGDTLEAASLSLKFSVVRS
ncbi:hypothetical protein MNBD_DELTA02-551 [hydrothermal vent metagenome]|uniref:FHA domain-containing protein n=1 Tax=hydrothermal vent metagenome TaxID=652676 RepID=A0A3B0VVV4_9ZZZZ